MAITDPRAIRFSDDYIRTISDRAVQYYYSAKSLVNKWYAESMDTLIPNEIDNILEDSAYNGDGRPIVSGAELTNIITRAQEYINDMEANSNAKLNTLLTVSVNKGVK